MSGHAIPGETYSGQVNALLTVDLTDLGQGYVDIWVHIAGVESASILLSPGAARALAHDLLRRADLADAVPPPVEDDKDGSQR